MKYFKSHGCEMEETIYVEEIFREIEFSFIIQTHYFRLLFFNQEKIVDFPCKFNSIEGLSDHPFYNTITDKNTTKEFWRRIEKGISVLM